MANIFSYIDLHGDKLFSEEKFNELDAVILSGIAYIDLEGIVSKKKKKIALGEAANQYFALYTPDDLKYNINGIIECIKIFKYIKNKKRYKDLSLYNYCYESGYEKQFSALFIDIDKETTFISFEGTDELIDGWKEDACMAYKFPVLGHKAAIKYVNTKVSYLSFKKYIYGGHSKGGNFALVAAMYSNPILKRRIKKIYSFDGPGLRKEQIESRLYSKISDRYEHIIPNYSVVGLFLKSYKNKVIKSNRKDLYAHGILAWEVENKEFAYTSLSEFSKGIGDILNNWLDKYDDKKREKIVNDMFFVFEKSGITTLLDIKESKIPSIFKILKNTNSMDKDSRDVIMELVKFLVKYLKDYEVEKIKNKFSKKNNEKTLDEA